MAHCRLRQPRFWYGMLPKLSCLPNYRIEQNLAPGGPPVAQEGQPPWEALLRFAASEGLDALIDCGALLAGTTNRCALGLL